MINPSEISIHLDAIESATVPFLSKVSKIFSPYAAGVLVGALIRRLGETHLSRGTDEFRQAVARAVWTDTDIRRAGS